MNRVCIPLLAFVALVGCTKESPPVVVLDSWWNVDYAKEACRTIAPSANGEPCVRDLRQFEREVQARVAADPACESVRLLAYDGPGSSSTAVAQAVGQPHWSLSFNFMPGAPKQRWQMLGPGEHRPLLEGEGSASKIATTVCNVLKKRGGSVES